MNKKFSTLLAGAALFGAVSAFAGNPVQSVKKTSKTLYQLQWNGTTGIGEPAFLSMNPNGALGVITEPNLDAADLASTLWCVEVIDEKLGQAPVFNFTNKATGQRLDLAFSGTLAEKAEKGVAFYTHPDFNGRTGLDSTAVGGEIAGWAFSEHYTSDMKTSPLFSSFHADSVIGFVVDAAGTNIQVKKVLRDAARTAGIFSNFTLVTADVIQLDAATINTMFGQQKADKGVALAFAPDEKGTKIKVPNPFNGLNAGKFTAVKAATGTLGYVNILTADSAYLRVDTSLTNAVGAAKFRAFKWNDLKYATLQNNGSSVKQPTAKDSIAAEALAAQYSFAFSYYPSVDSVFIQVEKALAYDETKATGSSWKTGTTTVLPSVTYTGVSPVVRDETYAKENFVTIQELVAGKEIIVTIANKLETKISFGYEGCTPIADNKTSVANGLYIITNEKGEALAAPIFTNGKDEDAYTFVKLDAQEPRHMPAYQWIITKDNESTPDISTVTMLNREFPNAGGVAAKKVQFRKDDNGKIFIEDGGVKMYLVFDQIGSKDGDSTIIKNERLGYKFVKTADLDVTEFAFNYLHPFNHGKWISLSDDSKDSILYVKDDAAPFTLKAVSDSAYGVEVTTALLKKIKGLAQLKRTSYTIWKGSQSFQKRSGDDRNEKYALSAFAEKDTFYFKENNHYNEKHYYAFVDKNSIYNQISDEALKVGVADDGITTPLKVQSLTGESRTSAFTVEEIDAPLYRRFAYDAPGLVEGRDTMRFIEQYRGEMLQLEGNSNFKVTGVDFLGINQESKAPSGLSFIVDTAWIGRGLGYIKPQYLISIDRSDVKGTPFQRCAECQRLIDAGKEPIKDCKHDIQATPDMNYGKYLVNFADSVDLGKMIGATKKGYDWKKYDRAGFVWAIQYGDSLYILKDEFAGVAKKDINSALLAKIVKANDVKIAAGKATDAYIINLTSDKHKYATWSMRYIKPGTDNKTFLMESMKDIKRKDVNGHYEYAKSEGDIAPEYAAWLKMQNGCLVLADSKTSKFNEMTGGDDALIFDIKRVANDPIVTENEEISTSNVVVIAGEGNVTVYGAAGKKVFVSDVLGKTTTVVATSDSQVIPAAQGVAFISVEGEAAVKAIVK